MISNIDKFHFLLILSGALCLFLSSCKKEPKYSKSVTDIDGNSYKTVKIGDQIWMAENLKVTHYRNGDPITLIDSIGLWENCTSGACCDFNFSPELGTIYGKLYNLSAVSDSRNIAPEGWHVATLDDWMTLVSGLGGEKFAGARLKEKGTEHWSEPNDNATNETGFTALPGGCINNGAFEKINTTGYWITSTNLISNNPYYFYMSNSPDVAWCEISFLHLTGYSVRCVKD
jgi:uncharacterized protein (TIGR02145 family)